MTEQLIAVGPIAACYGRALKTVYRLAKTGKLGPVIRTPQGMSLKQDAVERFFKLPFKPELKKNPPKRGRRSRADEIDAALLSPFAAIDIPFLMRRAAETRDQEWLALLAANKIELSPPPHPFGTAIDAQRFFTLQQVLKLIERAVELRDRNWDQWRNNPYRRSEGPAPLEVSAQTFNLK
jgi:hypothetical protein